MKDFDKEIRNVIRESLGKKADTVINKKNLDESYVTQAKKFDLTTELLSEKNKKAHPAPAAIKCLEDILLKNGFEFQKTILCN